MTPAGGHEHPRLREMVGPVPEGPPTFADADNGAGGPRRSRLTGRHRHVACAVGMNSGVGALGMKPGFCALGMKPGIT